LWHFPDCSTLLHPAYFQVILVGNWGKVWHLLKTLRLDLHGFFQWCFNAKKAFLIQLSDITYFLNVEISRKNSINCFLLLQKRLIFCNRVKACDWIIFCKWVEAGEKAKPGVKSRRKKHQNPICEIGSRHFCFYLDLLLQQKVRSNYQTFSIPKNYIISDIVIHQIKISFKKCQVIQWVSVPCPRQVIYFASRKLTWLTYNKKNQASV
jgi:hypothetical protein